MQIYNISKKHFNSLKPYKLECGVYNTEARMYEIEIKKKYETELKLLKKLYTTYGQVFSNKLYTINSLIDNKDKIDLEELVVPDKLCSVNNEIVGFLLPLINNNNLSVILRDPKIDFNSKLDYLKQIGSLLEKMKYLREYSELDDFYISDLHEGNIIVEKGTNKIKVVDLDSCKICHNTPQMAVYLNRNSYIATLPNKYRIMDNSNNLMPDENTDLYCYNIIILNTLYGKRTISMEISDYFDYIEYLEEIGYPEPLVESFRALYSMKDNVNPYRYLDYIPADYGRAGYKIFELNRKK